MTKVSVLIAVYNAKDYLSECLNSLIAQTMTDWEAICVDDASEDRSVGILKEYAQRDSRIKLMQLQQNHGQAYARNQALAMAKGQYVAFLDSDDWLSPDALEKVVDCFEHTPLTDVVLFQLVYVKDSKGTRNIWKYPQKRFEVLSGEEAFRLSLDWTIHGVYVVKADIHRRYPYDDSSRWYSDDNTTRLHYLAAREVRECDGIYYYRQHSKSVTHTIDIHRFDYLQANMSMRRLLKENNASEDVVAFYENVRWLNVVDVYMFYYKHRKEFCEKDRREGLAKIREAWQSIDTHSLKPRNKLKFGYCPFRCSWRLFRVEEELYFFLRSLLKR
ncbi:MAG: glycosyltransferase family 2 protein [Prevotella sp.]|jgi:glycosyltransferase involved in cell wall biosynthesis